MLRWVTQLGCQGGTYRCVVHALTKLGTLVRTPAKVGTKVHTSAKVGTVVHTPAKLDTKVHTSTEVGVSGTKVGAQVCVEVGGC